MKNKILILLLLISGNCLGQTKGDYIFEDKMPNVTIDSTGQLNFNDLVTYNTTPKFYSIRGGYILLPDTLQKNTEISLSLIDETALQLKFNDLQNQINILKNRIEYLTATIHRKQKTKRIH